MKRLARSVRHAAFAFLFLIMGATWVHAQVNMSLNDVTSDAPSAAVQQAVLPSGLSLGVRGAVTQSSFAGDAAKNTQPNMTVSGGAFLSVNVSDRFALRPEVMFNRWSAKLDHNDILNGAKDVRYTMDFLTIPVLLRGNIAESEGKQFYATAGPYVRNRLSVDAKSQFRPGLSGDDVEPLFRSWYYGLDVGVGIEAPGSRGSAYVDLRYHIGLTNLFDQDDLPEFRTRGAVLSLGFGI